MVNRIKPCPFCHKDMESVIWGNRIAGWQCECEMSDAMDYFISNDPKAIAAHDHLSDTAAELVVYKEFAKGN